MSIKNMPSVAQAYNDALNSKKSFPLDKAVDDFFQSSKKYQVQNSKINEDKEIIVINQSYSKFCRDITWSVLLVLFAFWALFSLLCYVLPDLTDLF